MAAYLFTKAMMAGEPIKIFNHGKMRRDFTYIDDIVTGVVASLDRPATSENAAPPVKLYNLGNSHAENLMDFVAAIESAMGRKAAYDLQPLQPGDVIETFADIAASTRDLGYKPTTSIQVGIPKFVEWYKGYHKS
jgi:UDP-glucuronate 4-epimerase